MTTAKRRFRRVLPGSGAQVMVESTFTLNSTRINAFINARVLPSGEGQKLINAALAIRTQIGC